jgi:DMSO/TMAO reductase YedYZ molybdopterin-dependent catalytic subunit
MAIKKERGLRELYQDPHHADAVLWSRRRVLQGAGAMTLARTLGAAIPYLRYLPAGIAPVALAQSSEVVLDLPGLRVLNDRPLNAETPAHLLDDEITPAQRLFISNNGMPPVDISVDDWELTIDGEACLAPRSFSIAQLKKDFAHHTYSLQLECGGNGRAEFRPRVPGNQWSTGAIGCPQWTGVRLRDVLEVCGIADSAVYVGFKGADSHLSGDPNKTVISRGVPMAKALEDESLIAFAMNGEDIPMQHGAPLRLVCGGWPGSVSGKWLTGLHIRDRVHDGAKMTGTSYRVPCRPVAPGETVADEDLCIIESMPVKSLITYPRSGIEVAGGKPVHVRGFAWAGDLEVARMAISVDFGQSWQPARLDPPANRLAWQRWQASVTLPGAGYYEVWARAEDSNGLSQPMLVPGWNPKGYLNNATHRIALKAT